MAVSDGTKASGVPATASAGPLTVVAFGDSITALSAEMPGSVRWPHLLEAGLRERLAPRSVRVVNAGVGGHTSREGLARLERDVVAHDPDLVLVQFGGNDATPDRARYVHPVEYAENLAAIQQRLRESGCAAMVLLTFPPVVDQVHGWRDAFRVVGGQDAFVEQYRRVTRTFACDHGLALFDLDAVIRTDPGRFILPDGVHLSREGNRAVAAALLPVVARLMTRKPAAGDDT
jgi:lysophospholipase L1-like esterase